MNAHNINLLTLAGLALAVVAGSALSYTSFSQPTSGHPNAAVAMVGAAYATAFHE